MITVSGVSVGFNGTDIFSNVSCVISPKDRIGLIGKNGVGKTTLLNIIAKQRKPDQGSIILSNDETIGYLPQQINNSSDKNVWELAKEAFDDINILNNEIEEINNSLENSKNLTEEQYEELLIKLHDKTDRFNYLDGNTIESNLEKVLKGLGFSEGDFYRNINEFSGGWRMRVELAKILLKQPDLILLDEPTNHLDIESIIWLEEYFNNYKGAIIIVSHDKMFLDNVTNRTIELIYGKLYDFKLPYSKFIEVREEQYKQQLATLKNQQKNYQKQQEFIDRFKAKATKARQAKSKLKIINKIEFIEVAEIETNTINFSFLPTQRSGKVVFEVKNLVKKYDEKVILDNQNFAIQNGERIAFVGRNGEGKTTLSKILANKIPYQGELIIGNNVNIGYYAQIQNEEFNENLTVLETLQNNATEEWSNASKIRALLGCFLFKKDDVDKKVKVLSGGEKSRLALARLLLKSYNVLILDEPTNHLDINSKEILKNALKNYDGTLIIVSHDREFLDGLVDKIFEFKNKNIKEHLCSINEFLQIYKTQNFRTFEKKINSKIDEEKSKKEPDSSNKTNYIQKKEQEKQIRKIKKQLSEIENEIAETDKKIKEIELLMQKENAYTNSEEATKISIIYSELKKKSEKLYENWCEINEEIEIN